MGYFPTHFLFFMVDVKSVQQLVLTLVLDLENVSLDGEASSYNGLLTLVTVGGLLDHYIHFPFPFFNDFR